MLKITIFQIIWFNLNKNDFYFIKDLGGGGG